MIDATPQRSRAPRTAAEWFAWYRRTYFPIVDPPDVFMWRGKWRGGERS